MEMLNSPMSASDISKLKLGDIVYVTGQIITGRDEMHIRALERKRSGEEVPECVKGCTLFHCGPIMKKEGDVWTVVAAGPTTSARMNKLEPEFIRMFKPRAIIGKGGMSRETADAMKACGCVYLAAVGGAAVTYAEGLAKVDGVEWEDLGMAEAIWKFDAQRFGPLVVAIDHKGNSLYEKVAKSIKR